MSYEQHESNDAWANAYPTPPQPQEEHENILNDKTYRTAVLHTLKEIADNLTDISKEINKKN